MVEPRQVEYRLFEALGEVCGVLVSDPATGEYAVRFRRDWAEFAGDEADVLAAWVESIPDEIERGGLEEFLRRTDDSLSLTIRQRDPRRTISVHLARTAQALFRQHVRSTVKPYDTHAPLIPIRAAAGGFGKDRATDEPEEWVDVLEGVRRRLHKDEFLVRIEGTSMEPDIPDGSICRFRRYVGGTRRGGIWLVQRITGGEVTGEVTVKRYVRSDDAPGRRQRERMEAGGEFNDEVVDRTAPATMRPLNQREHQDWDLDPESGDRYITIAEFIEVVEDGAPGETLE